MMVKIKICGLKRLEDIDYANALKIDYAGFVFAESKRKVDLPLAKKLVYRLDNRIKKVGVFVNEKREVIEKVVGELGLDVIQFHGDESPEDVVGYNVEVWKALRVKDAQCLEEIKNYPVDCILLDSPHVVQCNAPYPDYTQYGGTGRSFDWTILKSVYIRLPIILAGGLNPDNVVMAIEQVRPYAVDVSSGVETDGNKDFDKMKKFVERVRNL
ncbi:phosphoribosylanthranilate isomerase [Caldanaerobius fijiensis DSM 17918]|uniref:N-(5'-phosphoribosyl)anthranilate isomerase n=2 Tax=Caldanaerobius TaxID=862261 RepID=A0A1M4TAA3_9THEO|nr:phosphoribosylanthranilate isomerase [Caldanaerobius fijiensis]SHE41449.1 phosphoribosylanthranilate isomerase [Caldanaerobius fijiensis DSM 17918]